MVMEDNEKDRLTHLNSEDNQMGQADEQKVEGDVFLGYGRGQDGAEAKTDIEETTSSEYSESKGLYQEREKRPTKFQEEDILNPSLPLEKRGKLYIVSTPIGNPDDITRRAAKVLSVCDLIVCEERKDGAALLHRLGLKKDIDMLNEQNEIEKAPEILSLIQDGKKIGLISDGGTPLLADPGSELMRIALASKVDIEVVPGVTSLMAALVRSGFSLDSFVFGGFLPREKTSRLKKISELSHEHRTVAILETPYRLRPVLEAFAKEMPDRKAYLGMNLTMHFESHHYGTFSQIWDKFKDSKAKGEFVIVFEGNTSTGNKSVGERIERAYRQKSGNLADQYRHLEGGVKKRITIRKTSASERGSGNGKNKSYSDRNSKSKFGGRADKSRYGNKKGGSSNRGK